MAEETFYVAPGNDYRGVGDLPESGQLTASVIIPVYNRVQLLDNVLGGLAEQRTQTTFDVKVVDDGSDEDVAAVVAAWSDRINVELLRQERSGRGAGRARNLGSRESDGDVLIFLDADCIPDPGYVESHMKHHRRADNLVVTASRRHIDRRVVRQDLADFDSLLEDTGVDRSIDGLDIPPDDWRRVFYRRSQSLLLGDAAFRAVAGGLMSVKRLRFVESGGFDEGFRIWGGEDTELGWRLWNDGCFIIPENTATIVHQRSEDLEGSEGRSRSRRANLALVADKVPHRFYRKQSSHLFSVPKVSIVVTVEDEAEADRAWSEAAMGSFTDTELILIGSGDAVASRASVAMTGKFSIASAFGEAIEGARGEVVVLVDGRARFDRRLLARVLGRFEDARTTAVRVGYRAGGDRWLRMDDLARIDHEHGRSNMPFFVAIKRREFMKDRVALREPRKAVVGALERSRVDLLVTDLIEIPDVDVTIRGRLPRGRDIRAAGAEELARGIRRASRSTSAGPPDPGPRDGFGEEDDRFRISYVGLAGHRNLGDDVMLEAIRHLMPWALIEENLPDPRAVMLGGGTLLNADGYYLNKVRRVDRPNVERMVFGTGMRSESYWGLTERIEDWQPFLANSVSVGLRGPSSLIGLREWGFVGPASVIGDPALLFERPNDAATADGRIVLCPVFTRGDCWGHDDGRVFEEFSRLIKGLRSEGHEIVMLTAHPSDDRWAIEIMREAGFPNMPFVPGYEDLERSLDVLASADLVIGERLHAVVLAAAMQTRFVAVEYRPKLRDFVESIGADAWCVRTDQIDRLATVVRERLSSSQGHDEAVEVLRDALRTHADRFKASLGVGAPGSPDTQRTSD